ncbi:NVEALA domain-containing protein [Butyricimonas paravirosa]|uniref:NVEALA domain-containing protein n=1 Tax=Butyricimonas paravirosa TaxID=1472417 RepID=UPI00210D496E|nr:hypothetical protein [Butyricimonas paravirosa]MCQ4875233.1 hypothetical protein [Butyricimonas paravirosa]
MRNKYLKIVTFMLLVAGVTISLNLSIGQGTSLATLKLGNVEALTSPETENPYDPCVKAKGFCLIHGLDIGGIALPPEK